MIEILEEPLCLLPIFKNNENFHWEYKVCILEQLYAQLLGLA